MSEVLVASDRSASSAGAHDAAALRPRIRLDLSFNLIQVLRLAHAMVEAGCRLDVAKPDVSKLTQLRKVFGLEYTVEAEGAVQLQGVAVDHMKPECRIGSIVRPLVFPRAVFDYCRRRWPKRRPVPVTFPGLATTQRKAAIDGWLKLSGLRVRMPDAEKRPPVWIRAMRRLAKRFRLPWREYRHGEGVRFVLSDEGRVFPKKAWNVGYYALLLQSQFVLCPDGDYGDRGVAWTYRFFESVLCGAIPIVQNTCAAYDGFIFFTMSEPLSNMAWSASVAEHNFRLAMERMTVSADELRQEVVRLLAMGRSSA